MSGGLRVKLYIIYMGAAVPFFSCSSFVLNKYLYSRNWFMFQFIMHHFLYWVLEQLNSSATSEHRVAGGGKLEWRRHPQSSAKAFFKMRPTRHCGESSVLVARGWQGSAAFQIQQLREGIHTISPKCAVWRWLTTSWKLRHEAVIDFTHKGRRSCRWTMGEVECWCLDT